MAKPRKKKRAKKTPQELEALTTEEAVLHIFGPEGHRLLKEDVANHDKPRKNQMRIDHDES